MAVKRKSSPRGDRHKSTRADMVTRINMVASMLLSGKRRADIVQYSSEKWGVTDRQVSDYITAATELIRADANRSREELFDEHVARRREVYRRAIARNDLRSALAAAQDEAKLLGLYPGERHTIDARVHTSQDIVVNIVEDGGGTDNNQNNTSVSRTD